MKKIGVLLLALVMVFSLCACGAGSEKSDSPEKGGSPEQSSPSEPPTVESVAGVYKEVENEDWIGLEDETYATHEVEADETLTLNADGTGTRGTGAREVNLVWELNGDEISLTTVTIWHNPDGTTKTESTGFTVQARVVGDRIYNTPELLRGDNFDPQFMDTYYLKQ